MSFGLSFSACFFDSPAQTFGARKGWTPQLVTPAGAVFEPDPARTR